MKQILFFLFAILFCNTLFAQSLSYTFPREKINLKGPVKHMFRYEYPNNTTTYEEKKASTIYDSNYLNMSFHFNEKGIQTHQATYRNGKIHSVSSYLYNQEGNLSYIIRQDAAQIPITSREELLEFIKQEILPDTFPVDYQLIYEKPIATGNPYIYQAQGAYIKKYEYDMEKYKVFITSNRLEATTQLTLDNQNRVIHFEQYLKSGGNFELHATDKVFQKDLLAKKAFVSGEQKGNTV